MDSYAFYRSLKGKFYDEITRDFLCILIAGDIGGLIESRVATHNKKILSFRLLLNYLDDDTFI